MLKKRGILLGLALVALGGGLSWLLFRPVEPVYEGKPLGYWLRNPRRLHFHYSGEPVVSMYAIVFPVVDSRAVPFLIKALERRESSLDKAYRRLWNKSPQVLQARLPKPVLAVDIRNNAAMLLTRMGDDGRPAIPALVRGLNSDPSDNVRFSAAACLLAIGTGDPTARAAMFEASTNDTSVGVRTTASGVFRTRQVRGPVQAVSGDGEVFPLKPQPVDAPFFVPR